MKKAVLICSIVLAFIGALYAQDMEPIDNGDMVMETNGETEVMNDDWAMNTFAPINYIPGTIEEVNALYEESFYLLTNGYLDEAYDRQQLAQAGLDAILMNASEKADVEKMLTRDQRRLQRQLARIGSADDINRIGKFRTTFFGKAILNMEETLRDNASSWGELGKDILMFLIIILIGALVGWLIGPLAIKNLLHVIGFDALADRLKISKFFESGGLQNIPSTAIGNIIYWIILFFSFSIAIGYMQGEGLAFQRITGLFQYLPRAFLAIFLIIIGVALGSFFSRIIKSIAVNAGTRSQVANALGTLIMLFIVIFSITSALQALNLSTQLIKNITDHTISYILLGVAIALALGGRYLAGDFKLIRAYPKGCEMKIDGKKGVVKEIKLFYTVIYTEEGVMNVPNHHLARKITVKEA